MTESPDRPGASVSRRRFLSDAACWSAGAALTGSLRDLHAAGVEVRLPVRSTVHQFHLSDVIREGHVHQVMFQEMLAEALRTVGETETAGEAWRRWIGDDDIVLVKFNRVGQTEIGTAAHVAGALVASLRSADISPERIILLEAPERSTREPVTREVPWGWSDQTYDFGSGRDQFRAALAEASVVINVPALKTHHLAGISGALKNLSHGLVRHPARYHAHGCSPYIGDIVGCAAIRPKLKLNIVDALRVVFDGGPTASPALLHPGEVLLIAEDPVAADAVGLELLNTIRREKMLPAIGGPRARVPHLEAAQTGGTGTADLDYIHRRLHIL